MRLENRIRRVECRRCIETKPSGVRIASIDMPRSLGFDTVLNCVQNLLNRRSLRLNLMRMWGKRILPQHPITPIPESLKARCDGK